LGETSAVKGKGNAVAAREGGRAADPFAELIGKSPGIEALREQIRTLLRRQRKLSRLPPILIHGETGTGKGLLARTLHRASPRAGGPLIDINCAAIPDTLLEAELFGFERGAFTDARQPKVGLFQAASRGTIFLDEVGLLPEGLQAKLLKVIEERAVRRLGSTQSEPVDVWILTATNEDLAAATRERRFREDLYHRLAVLTLWLPPLRERREDIVLLAEHFLQRTCAEYQLPQKSFAAEARPALLAYRWPGNVRELSNVIERVALLSEAPLVTAKVLGLPAASEPQARAAVPAEEAIPLASAVQTVERDHLLAALNQTDWNVTRAAARLGISRDTLRYRIHKHALRPAEPPARRRRSPGRPGPPLQPAAPATPVSAAGAATPPLLPAPTGIRWERRRLTLLGAVLAVPPDSDSPLYASRALEVLVDKVQSFGGRVEELSPAGVFAAFGLDPVEDAPTRAAHAAMAILKAAERARRAGTEPLAVTMGIHVGQVLVGQAGGSSQIDAEAKRRAWAALEELVSSAPQDATVVSEAAATFLERRFDLVSLGDAKPGHGQAYRLAGNERTGLRLGRRMARFVGRRHELELLQSRLAAALRGHGQVVGIGGGPGIGKSRLIFEFRQSLAGERVTFIRGRCFSYGSTIPYFPILDMFRRSYRITETDPPETISEKIRFLLQQVGMNPDECAPYLLQVLAVKEGTERLARLTPEAIKSRTLDTLRQMSLIGSRQRPTVFVVEDLQWMDKTSEECFGSLVDAIAGAPILFLCTYRPGYQPPWMDKSYATQIALQPLSPTDSLSVVHSVLQTEQVPESVARWILDKAEGNPFFLEELARTVGEQGDLLPTPAVPDTIQDVLLARINRLSEEPKRLLQAASVLGREVSLRLLGAIWEGAGPLDPHLRELVRTEFLYEQTGAAEPVYLFTHALTQEVAYESLPPAERLTLHEATARAMEALYATRLEEAADRLAYHYSRTEQAVKAVEYLRGLAEKAARGHAHSEAVGALQEALTHAERLPPEVRDRRVLDLTLRQAYSLIPLGRFQEVLDLLLRQEPRLARLQDPQVAGNYYFLLGRSSLYLGDNERAAQSARRAIAEAGRCGDEATMGKAFYLLAQQGPLSGDTLQGLEHGRQAVALLERTGEQWWIGPAHWIVGLNYAQMGEFGPALEAQERARAIGEAIGDPQLQTSAAWAIGIIRSAMGDWEAGIEACRHGLERSPDPLNTTMSLGWLGFCHLEKGDAGHAIPLLEQSVQQLGQYRFPQFQGWFTVYLAEAYCLSGQLEKAHPLAMQGLQITQAARFSYGVACAERALGRIAAASGAFSDAETHFREALGIFSSHRARYDLGRTYLDLAAAAHAQQKHPEVAAHLGEAYRLFSSLQLPKYVAHTRKLSVDFAAPLPE
jgi:DNA-binding NtrC family response regulator/tetratricopeptide (TPR) repeat protein